MSSYQKLKTIFRQYAQLRDLQSVLRWDEAVMMPEGAGTLRAEGLTTLNTLSEKILVNRKNAKLLEAAKEENLSSWDKANLKWMQKKYQLAACLPIKLTEKITTESMACEQAWRSLRAENNWKAFLPHFKKLFKLVKEVSKRRGEALALSPYDALLDENAPGFNEASIDHIFKGLKQEIPHLIQEISKKQASEKVILPKGPFPIDKQKELGSSVMKLMGFNFRHGRLDESHHPFCGGHPNDVRITTRYKESEFFSSLSGICHETGHGLYEQGLPSEWVDQPVGGVNSMAMHESQSLLMESLVCCSQEFFQFLLPEMKRHFGHQEALTANNLYNLATRVEPIHIRVDSDEVTYQMHIILRYEIEKELMKGDLDLKDLPERWNQLMSEYLNISTKNNYKDGVMQDVHWSFGAFGYFPAYTLGRLIGAQIFASFLAKHPQFFQGLAQGHFQPIKQWLSENIYSKASSLSTNDLLVQVTGKSLDSSFFLNHIKKRYLSH